MKPTPEKLINYFKPYVPYTEIGDSQGIDYWKSRLLYILIIGILIFGFIAYIPSIYLSVYEKLWSVVILDTAIYGLVLYFGLSKKVTAKIKIYVLLVSCYVLGVALLLLVGPYGAGFIWLFVFPVIAGILLEYKSVVRATTVNAFTLCILGLLIYIGKPANLGLHDYHFMAWVVNSANFIALNFMISLSLSVILSRIGDSLKKEKKLTHLLKEKQNKLKHEKRKVQEADQLKSAFLANMSHEIRTPMNAIIGYANFLRDPAKNHNKIEKYAGIIIKSGNHLLNIINDIVDISKIDSGQMELYFETVDINELLIELYNMFYTQVKVKHNGSVRLKMLKDEEKRTIITDQTRFRQILINLISNAIKYTKKGSIIIGYEIQDEEILFFVKDTGVGIPVEMHQVIFERFRQSKKDNVSSGTGLGLSIAKACTELLGGKIWLESTPDVGTTFFFTLPYVKGKQSIKEVPENEFVKPVFNNEMVLIVEDDVISYLYLEEILENEGLKIIHAKNAMESIDNIKHNDKIDVILMDIQLPDINGWEATKRIKQIRPDLPVIAQTAYAYQSDYHKSIAAGCDDYLSKPVSREELLKTLFKSLNKSSIS